MDIISKLWKVLMHSFWPKIPMSGAWSRKHLVPALGGRGRRISEFEDKQRQHRDTPWRVGVVRGCICFYIFMSISDLLAYMSAHCMPAVPMETRRCYQIPGTEVTDGYEPPCGC